VSTVTLSQAFQMGVREEMTRDPTIFVLGTDLFERARDQGQIAGVNLVPHEGVGHSHSQHVRFGVDRYHVLERRVPDRFVELGSQELGDGSPDLACLAHSWTSPTAH